MRRVGVVLALLLSVPASAAVAAPSLNGRILLERPGIEIRTLAPNGRDEQPLAVGYEPAWSPDGHEVAFARDFELEGTVCCAAVWIVPMANPDEQRTLQGTDPPALENPQWSPTGLEIAYQVEVTSGDVKYQEIRVANRDGTNVRTLARANQAGRDQWSWSPDGTRIVLQQYPRGALAPLKIAVVDVRTGETTQLARGANPTWSPDGRTILFTRNGRIFSMAASGGRQVRLANGDVPRYSPDGKKIAFVRYRRKLPPQVLVMNARGGHERWLATTWTDYIYAPVWSPDSRHLLWEAQARTVDVVYGARVGNPKSVFRLGRAFAPGWSRPACTVSGTFGGEQLAATDAGDVLCGFGGDDRLSGGPAPDVVFGDLGNDVIDVRGGGSDAVSCGAGHDVVLADRTDRTTRDCEVVRR